VCCGDRGLVANYLEAGLCSFFLVEQELWDAQSLYPVHILDVVESLAEADVSVDALAHSQRECPVLLLEENHRDVRVVVVYVVFRREPGHDGLVVRQ